MSERITYEDLLECERTSLAFSEALVEARAALAASEAREATLQEAIRLRGESFRYEISQVEAREATLKRALVKAAVPLEVLSRNPGYKPSLLLQEEILGAVLDVRAALSGEGHGGDSARAAAHARYEEEGHSGEGQAEEDWICAESNEKSHRAVGEGQEAEALPTAADPDLVSIMEPGRKPRSRREGQETG